MLNKTQTKYILKYYNSYALGEFGGDPVEYDGEPLDLGLAYTTIYNADDTKEFEAQVTLLLPEGTISYDVIGEYNIPTKVDTFTGKEGLNALRGRLLWNGFGDWISVCEDMVHDYESTRARKENWYEQSE